MKKEESLTPGLIFFSEKIISVATGTNHCLVKLSILLQALDLVGKVMAWGQNNSGQLGISNQFNTKEFKSSYIPKYCKGLQEQVITNVYAGYNSSYAINQHGRVYVWGSNKDGVLGVKGQDAYGEANQYIKPSPWEAETEKNIVFLPNRAYFYEFKKLREFLKQNENNQKNLEFKQKEIIKE